MAALAGYLANIYITSTTSLPFTNLALVDSGDHKNFQASNVDPKRYWDPTVALTVQTSPDGTTWTTITVYTALFCGGKITLPSVLAGATPSVRVSGNYFAVTFLGDAKSIDIKHQLDITDVTSFQNPPSPWKTKLANLVGTDITLSKWYVDTTFAGYLAQRLVIVAYSNVTSGTTPNQRYECFAFLKDESIKVAVNAPTTDDLNFTSDGPVSFYQS